MKIKIKAGPEKGKIITMFYGRAIGHKNRYVYAGEATAEEFYEKHIKTVFAKQLAKGWKFEIVEAPGEDILW